MKDSKISKIIENANLQECEYTPYIFAWAMPLQGIILVLYQTIYETVFKAKYARELFALSDGEKIAIDWYEESCPTDIDNEKRPLLVCIGGLGGGS